VIDITVIEVLRSKTRTICYRRRRGTRYGLRVARRDGAPAFERPDLALSLAEGQPRFEASSRMVRVKGML